MEDWSTTMTAMPTEEKTAPRSYKNSSIFTSDIERRIEALLQRHIESQELKLNRIYEDIEAIHNMLVYLLAPPKFVDE
jgi:hypothetical protein